MRFRGPREMWLEGLQKHPRAFPKTSISAQNMWVVLSALAFTSNLKYSFLSHGGSQVVIMGYY